MPETDLAPPVLALLTEMRFDLYQEVPYGGRADIVGLRPSLTCVVELKKSLSLDVMAQAKRWKPYAHWIFVAVPRAKPSDGRWLAREICEHLGLGVLEVNQGQVSIELLPRLNRGRVSNELRAAVMPEHKTFAPAGSKGAFWSPWRSSVERLKAHVKAHEGCTIEAAVAAIGHHWANNRSARSCITTQIREGIIDGLKLDEGKLFVAKPPVVSSIP